MAATDTQEGAWNPEYVDPETANWTKLSPIQLQQYVDFYIQLWKTRNAMDSYLWNEFIEAFNPILASTYKKMTLATRGSLRDFLRQHDIYVPHGSRTTSHSSLYTTSQLELQPTWPKEELAQQLQHPDGLKSRLNAAWAKEHGKEPLPHALGEPIFQPQTPIRAP